MERKHSQQSVKLVNGNSLATEQMDRSLYSNIMYRKNHVLLEVPDALAQSGADHQTVTNSRINREKEYIITMNKLFA